MKYLLLLFWLALSNVACSQVIPLSGAHAHNDYDHQRPLLDALAHGFTSIEADVLLIDGKIYVGHDVPEGNHVLPTLVETYLQPLDSIIKRNKGALYPGYDQVCYLMIDIKTDAEATYRMLSKQLQPYASWIDHPKEGAPGNGVMSIFLSGNRPMETVLNDPECLVSLDGRPDDLGKGYSAAIMPVVSHAYYHYSKWKGEGEMPQTDQQKIKSLADKIHQEGKLFRLWATPEGEQAWAALQSLGVDLINTDDLKGLSDYLTGR